MTSDSASMPPACPSADAPSSGFTSPAEVDLREFVTAERVLIALDFDGVLAPLQDDPETSRILPESAASIAALSTIPGTRVALVSGRDIATLRRLAAPPDGVWIVGSHGAEVDLGAAARSPELTAAERSMLAAIDDHLDSFSLTLPAGGVGNAAPGQASAAGFRIERKPYSRTVHTRGFDAEFAAALHEHAVAVQREFPDIRVIEGHDITELAVKQATKGDGLRTLMAASAATAVAYFGDDVTDEDAFAELEGHSAAGSLASGLGIKVGPAPTRASVRIADPEAVAALLDRLAAQRRSAHES